MARKYTQYAFSAGKTPLSAQTFNERFADIDLRLHCLELVKTDWESAVVNLINIGLSQINESLMPLILQAQETLSSAEMQLGNGDCTITYNSENLPIEMSFAIDAESIYSITYQYHNGLLEKEEGRLNSSLIWTKTYIYDDKDLCVGWTVVRQPIQYRERIVR